MKRDCAVFGLVFAFGAGMALIIQMSWQVKTSPVVTTVSVPEQDRLVQLTSGKSMPSASTVKVEPANRLMDDVFAEPFRQMPPISRRAKNHKLMISDDLAELSPTEDPLVDLDHDVARRAPQPVVAQSDADPFSRLEPRKRRTETAPLEDFGPDESGRFSEPPRRNVPPPQQPTPTLDDPTKLDIASLASSETTEEEAAQLTELREQLAMLAKSKAELLNAKTLEAEITQIQKEIANLHAAKKLLDAQQTLQKVIDEFPDSPAAKRAKTMLTPQQPVPSPVLTPSPDHKFNGLNPY